MKVCFYRDCSDISKSYINSIRQVNNIELSTVEEADIICYISCAYTKDRIEEQNSKYYEERIIKIKEYLKSLKIAFKKIKSLNLEIQRLRKYIMNQESDTSSIKYYKKLQRIKSELLVNNNN